VTRGGITISGEKKEEHEVKEDNYYRSERSYGRFSRHIPLPERADVDKAEAKFKDGVLRIDMPIRPEEGRKKIEVKS
jgi:HSP20 family protein